jgi:hypothetical protein
MALHMVQIFIRLLAGADQDLTRSATRMVGLNKSGIGCPPPNKACSTRSLPIAATGQIPQVSFLFCSFARSGGSSGGAFLH